MEQIEFCEWVAENHFVLYNLTKEGLYIWRDEKYEYETKDLHALYVRQLIKNNKV